MKRRIMCLTSFAIMIAMMASCGNTMDTPALQVPDPTVQTTPVPAEQTPEEPKEQASTSPQANDTPSTSPEVSNESDSLDIEPWEARDYSGFNYEELKAEFEKYIEIARNSPVDDYNIYLQQMEAFVIFKEMLNHRQSLEDFRDSIEFAFPDEELSGYSVLIDVDSVFKDGSNTYRVLRFTAHRYISRLIYIQIYDEESLVSHYVYGYIEEGGIGGEIVYCGFKQEHGKTYLVIIHREDNPNTTEYYLVNYEIDGNEIHKYNALKNEVAKGIWNISETNHWGERGMHIRVAYSDWVEEEEDWWSILDINNHASFENNKLTIVLENEEKDEISLIFKDGFWEVVY